MPSPTAVAQNEPPHRHLVNFYEDDEQLLCSVAGFLAEGAVKDEAMLVIATAAHRAGISARLDDRGLNAQRLIQRGQLCMVDAQTLMDDFLDEDGPDWNRFHAAVEKLLHGFQGGQRPVRAYGEMVDLLWQDGRLDIALGVEECWNRFLRDHAITLLCGYRMSLLGIEWASGVVEPICAAHGESFEGPDRERLDAAVAAAIAESIDAADQQRLRQEVAGGTTLAERMVAWIREHLPTKLDAVLLRAHANYFASAGPALQPDLDGAAPA